MKKFEKIINSLIISIAFTFNICIFAPIEFYYMNIFDFWFPIKFVLPTIFVISIIVFLVLFWLLYFLNGKKRKITALVLFGVFLALYIQGNFLNIGYGQLDGSSIDWSQTIVKGVINFCIWIILISIPIILLCLNEKHCIKIINFTSAFIFLVEGATLAVILLTYVFSDNFSTYSTYISDVNKNYYLDETDIFNMSKDDNIIFFMVDSIEASFMNNLLEKNSDLKTDFSDFTYFDNVTGTSLLTYMSMPTLLTGEELEVGKAMKENINNCYDNSNVFTTLKENGFNTELYVSLSLIPTNSSGEIITNKIEKEANIDNKSKVSLSKSLYKCVFYKYMPHLLKPIFYLDSSDFSKVTFKEVKSFFQDDVALNELLLSEGIRTDATSKTYKVIEMQAGHSPFNITRDIKYDTSSEYFSQENSIKQENQMYASLKVIDNYMNELKKNGIYDNTTIIVSADHGFFNRYNPALLIKRKAEHHDEILINHAPISELEDFTTTILNIATNSKNYGKDVYDYTEGENRTRKLNNYYFARDNLYRVYVESNIEVTTNGDASNLDDYFISNQIFSDNDEIQKKYKFNKRIDFANSKNLEYAKVSGILKRTGDVTYKGTTVGNYASITIKPDNSSKDVQGEIKIDTVYDKEQGLIIKVGNKELYNNTIKKPTNVRFNIPKEIWNSGEELKLDLEFPDAHTYSSNEQRNWLGTDWVQRAFVIDSIKFDN